MCLEDSSEILSTVVLKEHVLTGPYERAINLDLVCRLYHKLKQIGGAQAIRGDILGLTSDWKERMNVSTVQLLQQRFSGPIG